MADSSSQGCPGGSLQEAFWTGHRVPDDSALAGRTIGLVEFRIDLRPGIFAGGCVGSDVSNSSSDYSALWFRFSS